MGFILVNTAFTLNSANHNRNIQMFKAVDLLTLCVMSRHHGNNETLMLTLDISAHSKCANKSPLVM